MRRIRLEVRGSPSRNQVRNIGNLLSLSLSVDLLWPRLLSGYHLESLFGLDHLRTRNLEGWVRTKSIRD